MKEGVHDTETAGNLPSSRVMVKTLYQTFAPLLQHNQV